MIFSLTSNFPTFSLSSSPPPPPQPPPLPHHSDIMASGDDGSDGGGEPPAFQLYYDTLAEAKDAVYTDAKKHNTGVAILRSHPDRKTREVRRVDMVCSRSTTYKASTKPRTKDSSSFKTACPWKVVIVKYKDTEKWQVCPVDTSHNHPQVEELSALTDHRQRDIAAVYEAIDEAAGQAPAQILDNLRKANPATTIQPRDVYNARARLRRRRLGKYTPIQALLKALHQHNWFMKFELEANSKRVRNKSSVNL